MLNENIVMMNRSNIIRFWSILLCCVTSMLSCEGKNDPDKSQKACPLTAFAVKVGDSWYHSNIDQDNNMVSIGLLASGMGITDISYTLCDGAEIHPDPESFIGRWEQTQTVEVTADGEKTVYTLTFTDWVDTDRSIIFMDEFQLLTQAVENDFTG